MTVIYLYCICVSINKFLRGFIFVIQQSPAEKLLPASQ